MEGGTTFILNICTFKCTCHVSREAFWLLVQLGNLNRLDHTVASSSGASAMSRQLHKLGMHVQHLFIKFAFNRPHALTL